MMANRILVVGSTNVDLVTFMDHIPAGGETLIGIDFQQHFGGKGANQAVMAARCGVPVVMISGIGNDSFGTSMVENLRENGIETGSIFEFQGTSGLANIWVENSGENRITIIPGANYRLVVDDVLNEFNKLDSIGYVIAQCEVPLEIVSAVFSTAKKRGILTIFNPAPFLPIPDELLANTDWLIVNETEFSQLHHESKLPTSDEIIKSLKFEGRMLVTLGSDGAVLVDDVIVRVPAPKKNPVDTTGAGDCLIGSFVAGLALGFAPEKALRFGITIASESVTRAGAQTSFPTKQEVKKIIEGL